jgi:hypothetical protein
MSDYKTNDTLMEHPSDIINSYDRLNRLEDELHLVNNQLTLMMMKEEKTKTDWHFDTDASDELNKLWDLAEECDNRFENEKERFNTLNMELWHPKFVGKEAA